MAIHAHRSATTTLPMRALPPGAWRPYLIGLITLAAVPLLAGCAGTRPAAYRGLASSDQLQPNLADRSGRTPYAYAPPVDWRDYRRLIIEPVAIYQGPDAQFGKIPERGRQALAGYMQDVFAATLAKRFELVRRPAPNTLRLRLTLTGAKPTTPVAATFSRFDLAGGPYNVVQSIRGKEGALTGSVFYAIEFYDAASNRLLRSQIVKQYPSPMNIGASFGALGAAKAGIRKGAADLSDQIERDFVS